MQLNQPTTVTLEHRAELPAHLAYLSGGGVAYVSATVRAGGFLNPAYMQAIEQADMAQRVRNMEIAAMSGAARITARDEMQNTFGRDTLNALYSYCVVSWETNIQSEGAAIAPTKANFLALADVGIAEIAEWVVGLSNKVSMLADFIAKADEETVKN